LQTSPPLLPPQFCDYSICKHPPPASPPPPPPQFCDYSICKHPPPPSPPPSSPSPQRKKDMNCVSEADIMLLLLLLLSSSSSSSSPPSSSSNGRSWIYSIILLASQYSFDNSLEVWSSFGHTGRWSLSIVVFFILHIVHVLFIPSLVYCLCPEDGGNRFL